MDTLMTLLEQTIKLIKQRKTSIKAISDATGVSTSAINQIQSGEIPNPGILSVQALHDYLSKHHD